MDVKIIHNRNDVYEFLKDKSRYDYLYQFYDLEESNWRDVICYGLFERDELKQIAVLVINYGIPVLLAASYQNIEYNIELLKRIRCFLPSRFYTHIDKETFNNVFDEDEVSGMEEYINMGLNEQVHSAASPKVVRLGYEQINDIRNLMAKSYPEAWLDDELVKLRRNFGIYNGDELVSFAGIHAYSEAFQVAAIAHVTTHPDFRRQGYGESVVSALIENLKNDIKYIGLNVKADNSTAINCYRKLSFKEYGRFAACEIQILNKA